MEVTLDSYFYWVFSVGRVLLLRPLGLACDGGNPFTDKWTINTSMTGFLQKLMPVAEMRLLSIMSLKSQPSKGIKRHISQKYWHWLASGGSPHHLLGTVRPP